LKLLITGASGLLGSRLAELAIRENHEVYSAYSQHQPTYGTPIQLDISDKNHVEKAFKKIEPEAVVHTAALTDVDKCELEKELAWKINVEGTNHIATASACMNSHLTYVSTDYVFDGEKGCYREENQANPISHYGYTKLKGEEIIKEHATKWCITRPSVLYGWLSHKQNFATWLINNLNQKKEVKILKDQYISPTLNTNLAEMLLEIAERNMTGTLHTAGATRVSRHEFALKLAEVFNLNIDLVKPAKMNEMPWRAKRPRDSSLNVSKALTLLNQKPLKLEQALKLMKTEEP
jgi:dTDP-4-dehydrorhamnose reductase